MIMTHMTHEEQVIYLLEQILMALIKPTVMHYAPTTTIDEIIMNELKEKRNEPIL